VAYASKALVSDEPEKRRRDVVHVLQCHGEALALERVLVAGGVADQDDSFCHRKGRTAVLGGKRRARPGGLRVLPSSEAMQAGKPAREQKLLRSVAAGETRPLSVGEAEIQSGPSGCLRKGEEEQVGLSRNQIDPLIHSLNSFSKHAGDEMCWWVDLEGDGGLGADRRASPISADNDFGSSLLFLSIVGCPSHQRRLSGRDVDLTHAHADVCAGKDCRVGERRARGRMAEVERPIDPAEHRASIGSVRAGRSFVVAVEPSDNERPSIEQRLLDPQPPRDLHTP